MIRPIVGAGPGLPVLAGALLLLLAAEWLWPGSAAPAWRQPLPLPSATADASNDANVTQWTNTILARPILSPSRRPAAAAQTTVDETLPRLSAIIVIGGARQAIFAAAGGTPQLVKPGGQIGLYRIKSVAPDTVDLLGPNGPVTVKPQFIAATPMGPGISGQ